MLFHRMSDAGDDIPSMHLRVKSKSLRLKLPEENCPFEEALQVVLSEASCT